MMENTTQTQPTEETAAQAVKRQARTLNRHQRRKLLAHLRKEARKRVKAA